MRFMVLVKANRESESGAPPDEKILTAMAHFNEELVRAGVMLGGEGLHPSSKGKRIRFANGKQTVIDGPFAETKELVAGYWILQLRSLDEAVAWMQRSPFRQGGEADVEIRQMFETADYGPELTPEARALEEIQRERIEKGLGLDVDPANPRSSS